MKTRRPRTRAAAPRIAVTAQAPSTAGAVVLDGREHPDTAQDPAAHLEVPAVALTTSHQERAEPANGRLERVEPLGALLPALAPDGRGSRPWQHEAGHAAPSPRRETVTEPTPQASHRLEHVEESREAALLQPVGREGRSAGERCPRHAQAGLGQGSQGGDREEGHGAQERPPEARQHREATEGEDEQRPLGHEGKRTPDTGSRLVDGLKGRDAPDPVIDSPAAAQHAREPFAIDSAAPGHVTGRVVLLRPLPLEQGLSFAVPLLLLPVGPDRVAPVVPDHRSRAEPDGPPLLLQAPAEIHVVARGPELRIEPADRLEGGSAERHVAPGDMLGLAV